MEPLHVSKDSLDKPKISKEIKQSTDSMLIFYLDL